jgi:hypothetical protein
MILHFLPTLHHVHPLKDQVCKSTANHVRNVAASQTSFMKIPQPLLSDNTDNFAKETTSRTISTSPMVANASPYIITTMVPRTSVSLDNIIWLHFYTTLYSFCSARQPHHAHCAPSKTHLLATRLERNFCFLARNLIFITLVEAQFAAC